MVIWEKSRRKIPFTLPNGNGRGVLAGFSEFSLHPPIWTGTLGLAENLVKFLLPLPTGGEIPKWPAFAEISSSAFPLERNLEFERIISPLPISENFSKIEPLVGKFLFPCP